MADIHIQKKEGPGAWLWILGLVVVAVVIWAIAALTGDNESEVAETSTADTTGMAAYDMPDTTQGTEATTTADVPQRISSFVAFVQDSSEQGTMGLSHSYTATGIRHLAAALSAMVDQFDLDDRNITAKRDTLRQRADRLQANEESVQHSNIVRDAFTSAADVMNSIQDKHFPSLDDQVNQVISAAESVDPDKELLNQREAVKIFFRDASVALNSMAQHQPAS